MAFQLLAAVGAIIAVSLYVAVASLRLPQFYLNADIGHYLADSAALFGHGVRELRHPPMLPLLIGLIHSVVHDDLVAVQVAVAVVIAVLDGCFFFFIRGRTGSTLGDVGACALFTLAPTTAEAVGWFGLEDLMGIGLGLVVLRLVSNLVARPTTLRAAVAALAAGATVLTHPFAAAFTCETVAAYLAMRALLRASKLRSVLPELKPFLHVVAVLAVVAAGGLLALAFSTAYYGILRSPFVLAPSTQYLDLIWTWAFRENAVIWMTLLIISLLILPLAKWIASEQGEDLALAVMGVNIVTIANVVLLYGDPSYVTRNLYFLPVSIAATLGVIVSAVGHFASHTRPSLRPLLSSAPWALLILVGVPAFQAYTVRLNVAVPYYNRVDNQEFAAMRFLRGHTETVIVTSKGQDLEAGTEYAWMIEGLAHERALGTGLAVFSLAAIADRETADAERFVAGPAVIEDGRVRAAFDGTLRTRIKIFANIDGSWLPLFNIEPVDGNIVPTSALVSTRAQQNGGEITSRASKADPPATLELDNSDHLLHVALPANQLAMGHMVTINPVSATGRFSNDSSGLDWRGTIGSDSVIVSFSAHDYTAQAASVEITENHAHLRARDGSGLTIDVGVKGLTARPAPVRTFTQSQLIRDERIGYVWTWRETGLVDELAARSCLTLAYENDRVAIFRIGGPCNA